MGGTDDDRNPSNDDDDDPSTGDSIGTISSPRTSPVSGDDGAVRAPLLLPPAAASFLTNLYPCRTWMAVVPADGGGVMGAAVLTAGNSGGGGGGDKGKDSGRGSGGWCSGFLANRDSGDELRFRHDSRCSSFCDTIGVQLIEFDLDSEQQTKHIILKTANEFIHETHLSGQR